MTSHKEVASWVKWLEDLSRRCEEEEVEVNDVLKWLANRPKKGKREK